MAYPIRVLMVTDTDDDISELSAAFNRGGYDATFESVRSAGSMQNALQDQTWDVVFADYFLADFDGLSALRLFHQHKLDLPVIVIANDSNDEMARKALFAGANAFLDKNNLDDLAAVVDREIDEIKARQHRNETQAQLHLQATALSATADSIVITDNKGNIQWVNPAYTTLTGYTCEQVMGGNPRILKSGKHNKAFYKRLWDTIMAGQTWYGEIYNKRKDGTIYLEEETITPVLDGNQQISHFIAIKRDITERKKLEEKTALLLKENRLLAQSSITMQEDERRNLAHELHDELGQCLTALQADIEFINLVSKDSNQEIYQCAQGMGSTASQIYDMLKRIMHRLRPQTLDNLGLVDALQEYLTEWYSRHSSFSYRFETKGKLDVLSDVVSITIYRIVQECLNNVVKHSKASFVAIKLQQKMSKKISILELVVKDDGKGMEQNGKMGGLGLLGMRERTISAGGQFKVKSKPNQGVCITVKIPLTEAIDL